MEIDVIAKIIIGLVIGFIFIPLGTDILLAVDKNLSEAKSRKKRG